MDDDLTSRFKNPKLTHLPPPPPNHPLLQKASQVQRNVISIQQLVRDASAQHASDIHIRVGEVPRFRIRGEMISYERIEKVSPNIFEGYLEEILSPSARQRFTETKELDTAIFYPGLVRCRVNCFETLSGGAMVLRLITLQIPSIDSLGLPPILKYIIGQKQGLILVTGPTGSGKSTTLAAMIRHLNETAQKHIITIEDPIEYVHASQKSLISQREVGLHTNEFHHALKSVLREDPDVILIGEMRDRMTVDTALKAAQTGHLVLGTLHTKNAIGSINRLLNIYNPEEQAAMRVQIVDSLVAIVAQQLLPTTDGRRVAALEILMNTPAMQDYLLKGEEVEAFQLMESSTSEGMQVMNHALCELMLTGQISIEDAVSASPDFGDLRRRARNGGLDPAQSTKRDFELNYSYKPR
ncbi:PilT/PilU family type 4a pilus ATPase [Scytonema sp. UIC 10036]|uniref:type IV pilus twitching motility protein PilT n=1 Tax=Scytonema sp. UIC 10036 TaxID=2304196 RepID=UPI0012DAA9A0|nr:PilT/PilU family type 4a pilus ATPase [Scytonema sp. UIC 10036]MUG95849.1 PilT/PilU family type 4a pilus ATPase [Scytonema sp. UIC 10036]